VQIGSETTPNEERKDRVEREREGDKKRFGSIDIGETFWLFGSR
jgi:hypothetical protein